MAQADAWSDLRTRGLSAVVMIAVGGVVIWLGGWPMLALGAVIVGMMVWELTRMIDAAQAQSARIAGLLGAGVFVALSTVPLGPLWWPVALLVPVALAGMASRLKPAAFLYSLAVMLAVGQILALRETGGIAHLLWVVLVVVASDIMGYFAGRMLGGPKFWPKISPKKTWSGTVAGWVGAGVVGLVFVPVLGASLWLVPVSVVMAFAAQMGDIAESAIKRRAGIKDSSNLIPGHGGLMDRFDGFVGAGACLFIASALGVAL